MLDIIRQGLLESGQNFVNAGLLDQVDDLFFLYIRELDEIAKKGEFPLDISRRITERRALREREILRKQIPRVLLSDGTAFYEGAAAPEENENAIVGDPVSPGVVEGKVKVVFDPRRSGWASSYRAVAERSPSHPCLDFYRHRYLCFLNKSHGDHQRHCPRTEPVLCDRIFSSQRLAAGK